jgi:hypothetical protein
MNSCILIRGWDFRMFIFTDTSSTPVVSLALDKVRWMMQLDHPSSSVRARFYPCGICGGQSGTVTGFSQSSSVFPCQYYSTVVLYIRIIWGMNNISVSGSSSET